MILLPSEKKLRLPPTVHPQTTELVQEKEAEDTMGLLMRMNQRIIQMEEELERQSKASRESRPPNHLKQFQLMSLFLLHK